MSCWNPQNTINYDAIQIIHPLIWKIEIMDPQFNFTIILRIGGPSFGANVNWFLWCAGIMSCITCRSSSYSASTSPSPAPCLNSSSLRLVTYLIYNPGILDFFCYNRYFILSFQDPRILTSYATVAHFNRQVEICVNLIKIDLNHYKYPQYYYTNFEKIKNYR